MLILRAAGVFYVLSLEALCYNFSWPLLTHLSKSQTGQKEGIGVCGWILFGVWKGTGNPESRLL